MLCMIMKYEIWQNEHESGIQNLILKEIKDLWVAKGATVF